MAIDKGLKKELAKKKYEYYALKPCKDDKQIEKDIKRTLIPPISNPDLREAFYDSIRRVLLAFSNFNTSIGYVQGMNIIASCLLFNISNKDFTNIRMYEADAFYLLAALMERYQIGTCYINDMKRIFELSKKLETLLEEKLPTLFKHINNEEVNSLVLHFCLLLKSILLTGFAHHAYRIDWPSARRRFPLWTD